MKKKKILDSQQCEENLSGHYAKWKKSVREGQILNGMISLYVESKNKQQQVHRYRE